jgi:hypothetical protein
MRFDLQASNELLDTSKKQKDLQIERAERVAYVWRCRVGHSTVHDLKVDQSVSNVVMQHAFVVVRRNFALKTVLS